MSLDEFEIHLRDPAPGFRCYDCRDRAKKPTFVASIEHEIGEPGSSDAIAFVSELCGSDLSALRRFVELHDGVVLYRDKNSDDAGIEVFPAEDWESRTLEMREGLAAMGLEPDELPDWFQSGTVFGEIPCSSNYFVIQPTGEGAGQIFYCDHDDFNAEPIADSFDSFLRMIVDDPPRFLEQCGCYARYSDGSTDIQWIPVEYLSDVHNC